MTSGGRRPLFTASNSRSRSRAVFRGNDTSVSNPAAGVARLTSGVPLVSASEPRFSSAVIAALDLTIRRTADAGVSTLLSGHAKGRPPVSRWPRSDRSGVNTPVAASKDSLPIRDCHRCPLLGRSVTTQTVLS